MVILTYGATPPIRRSQCLRFTWMLYWFRRTNLCLPNDHLDVARIYAQCCRGTGERPPVWMFRGVAVLRDYSPILPTLAVHWHVARRSSRPRQVKPNARTLLRHRFRRGCCRTGEDHRDAAVLIGHSLGALVALGSRLRLRTTFAIVLFDPRDRRFSRDSTALIIRRSGGPCNNSPARDVSATAEPCQTFACEGRIGETIRLGEQRDAAALRFMRGVSLISTRRRDAPLEGRWRGIRSDCRRHENQVPNAAGGSDPTCGGMMTPSDSAALADSIQDCMRIDLPEVGHLVHWQEPAKVSAMLHAFLASLS